MKNKISISLSPIVIIFLPSLFHQAKVLDLLSLTHTLALTAVGKAIFVSFGEFIRENTH